MRHNVFSPAFAKMKRAYNFHAGPAGLPAPVLREAADSLLTFEDAGASIMEVSHRGRHFLRVYEETEQALREALDAPQEYRILFLAGGARGQAAAIPMNLLGGNPRAAYIITGPLVAIRLARRAAVLRGARYRRRIRIRLSRAARSDRRGGDGRMRLFALRRQRNRARRRIPRAAAFRRAAHSRYVVEHFVAPDSRFRLRPDLRRRAKKLGPRRA